MTDQKNGTAKPNLSPEQQQLADVLTAALSEVVKNNHAYLSIVVGTREGAGFEHMYAAPDLAHTTEVLHSKLVRTERKLANAMDMNEMRQRQQMMEQQKAAAAAAAGDANNDNGPEPSTPKPAPH